MSTNGFGEANKYLVGKGLCVGAAILIAACNGSTTDNYPVSPTATPVVAAAAGGNRTVTGGTISGIASADGSIGEYLGIPFAAPPIGNLRWKPPQPVVSWTGIKSTVAYSLQCEQGSGTSSQDSEDCLYLNVFSRNDGQTNKPVILYAYGGGNETGGAGTGDIPEAEAMARKGVVFIDFNYRGAIFGYLAHPLLTAEDPNWPSSGNYGLLDYIAALKWIQANITQFGGNPNNVTLAGQSAGASNIEQLIGSPLAKGLFQQAFAMSSNTWNKLVPSRASQEALGTANFPNMTLAQMRAMTPAQLLALPFDSQQAIVYTLDGVVLGSGNLTQYNQGTVEFYKNGTQNDIPLVNANDYEDGSYVEDIVEAPVQSCTPELVQYQVCGPFTESFNQAGNPPNLSQTDFTNAVNAAFGPLAAQVFALYPAPAGTLNYLSTMKQINIDGMMAKSNYLFGASRALHGKAPTYVFQLTRAPAGPNDETSGLLATHGSDVQYWFNYLNPNNALYWSGVDLNEADVMSSYMVNFATTGNPNGVDPADVALPQWTPYSAGQPVTYMDSNNTFSLTTLSAAKSALWQQYVTQILADTVGR